MAALIEREQVGKREDLSDLIAVADSKSTPLLTMIPKGREPANTLVEWQADAYPDPAFAGVMDGEDVTEFENLSANRARLSGRIQIFRRTPRVSRLAQNVSDVAGVGKKKEMARQIAKGIVMIKRDMEAAFCSDQESQAEAAPASPYKTRGLGKWIQATAQSDLPVDSAFLTPSGSINTTATASLTEALIDTMLSSMWDQTGVDKTFTLLCGRSLRARFSQLTNYQTASTNVMGVIRTYNQPAEARKIVNTVDIYEGDFGTLELHPSHWLARDTATAAVRNARGYALDMDMLEVRFNQRPTSEALPDQGGGPRTLIEAIAALVCKNPLGLGKFAATS